MSGISDRALAHLRAVADTPDLGATRYALAGRLGRGGMGAVWLAHDTVLDRDVALKVANAEADRELTERLAREAGILARLEHPGIVPVHDVGTLPDGRVFYVMKRIRGERLDVHARSLATVTEVLRLLVRVAEPVAFAHAQGVVHRDLTPGNVMVGPFGEVLVLDWGIATAADGAAAGHAAGTPGFMAPDQVAGGPVDARSDVYGLGALLAFLLEGRVTPRPVAAIRTRAMAPVPEDRYATVVELAADVARFLDGEAVAAYRELPFERLNRVVAKYRTPILLVAAYLLMRVLLLLFGGT